MLPPDLLEELPLLLLLVLLEELEPDDPLDFPANTAAEALAGAVGFAASGFCESGRVGSSCIVSFIVEAAGLAEVGLPDSPGVEGMGESDASRFRTRTFAFGLPLDSTALAS